MEFDNLYEELIYNINKIDKIKTRTKNDEIYKTYGFEVYEDWIKQDPIIESRANITDILAEFTNTLSTTNFKNYYTTNPIVKKYLRKNTYEYSCKDTRNVRCCNHSTLYLRY